MGGTPTHEVTLQLSALRRDRAGGVSPIAPGTRTRRWRVMPAVRTALGLAVATSLTFAALLVVPSASHAGCGYTKAASSSRPTGLLGRSPFIVGDSTMEYAVPMLAARGYDANSMVCRQFSQGVAMLQSRRSAGVLPRVSLLSLGANGPIAGSDMERALRIVGEHRMLGLVTSPQAGVSRSQMIRASKRHPDRVLLIDWASYSAGRGWFDGDGLHPSPAGARAFTRLVARRMAPFVVPPYRNLKISRRARGARVCGAVRSVGRWRRVYIVRGSKRILCTRARQLARLPLTQPADGWTNYDWRGVRRAVWQTVTVRRDRGVVVATVAGRTTRKR